MGRVKSVIVNSKDRHGAYLEKEAVYFAGLRKMDKKMKKSIGLMSLIVVLGVSFVSDLNASQQQLAQQIQQLISQNEKILKQNKWTYQGPANVWYALQNASNRASYLQAVANEWFFTAAQGPQILNLMQRWVGAQSQPAQPQPAQPQPAPSQDPNQIPNLPQPNFSKGYVSNGGCTFSAPAGSWVANINICNNLSNPFCRNFTIQPDGCTLSFQCAYNAGTMNLCTMWSNYLWNYPWNKDFSVTSQ